MYVLVRLIEGDFFAAMPDDARRLYAVVGAGGLNVAPTFFQAGRLSIPVPKFVFPLVSSLALTISHGSRDDLVLSEGLLDEVPRDAAGRGGALDA